MLTECSFREPNDKGCSSALLQPKINRPKQKRFVLGDFMSFCQNVICKFSRRSRRQSKIWTNGDLTETIICMYIFMYVYIYVRMYIYIYLSIYTYICIYMSIYTYVYTFIDIYIHTYIYRYIFTYIHINIHTYIHVNIYMSYI